MKTAAAVGLLALGLLFPSAAHAARWDQFAKLTASDGVDSDLFGYSVGIAGNTAIVGAPWHDDQGDASGSAYLHDVATGAQLAKLTPNDGVAGDQFGISVAQSGSMAIASFSL